MMDHIEYDETIEAPARWPARWLRPLLKAPALLYDVGLGWVCGRRFLLLTHRGRRTGRIHRTVLEVVSYDAERGEATVVSAWGREHHRHPASHRGARLGATDAGSE